MLFGFLMIMGLSSIAVSADKAKKAGPATLDAAFDGRPDVVFKVTLTSVPFEDVVLGAQARGYDLSSQSDTGGAQTLIFRRRPVDSPSA